VIKRSIDTSTLHSHTQYGAFCKTVACYSGKFSSAYFRHGMLSLQLNQVVLCPVLLDGTSAQGYCPTGAKTELGLLVRGKVNESLLLLVILPDNPFINLYLPLSCNV